MSIYSRLDRIAADVEKLNRQVKSVSNAPQSQRTSVEGGSIDFNDADGNLQAIFGGQDDGSTTVRHVDGPTPPIPQGLTAHVDGPIIQVTWDGTFEDGVSATFDWSHLEVVAVGPSSEQLRGTISDVTGASTSLAATASGVWTVVARSVSRAGKRSLDGDAGTVEVEIVGLSGAINDAIGSANGKNTVTYSETPPTSEDEGIDGDTWFVNSVDPETSIMLITEQWQFLAGAWVQTELDHEVIATIDAGKITVGELDGIRIMGKTVRGEQLSGDAIDGKVITGGTYRTSDGTGEWSDGGLFIARPDGTSMVRFPTDGSPLSLTASDTQIERASVGELDMVNGAVRSGGTFNLAAGVTAPPSPPELTTGWQKVCTLEKPDTGERYDWTGLASWGDKWVRTVNVIGERSVDLDSIVVYDEDGTIEDSFVIDNNPRHGVAVIGDVAYVLGPDRTSRPGVEKNWMHGFDLNTGERVSRWEFTRFAGGKNQLGVGTDGTNLLVAGAHLTVSRRLYVMAYDPVTGSQVGSDLVSDEWVAYTKDVQGVHRSGSTLWVSHVEAVREFTVSGSTITYTNNGWVNPDKDGAGVVWRGGLPYVVDGVGDVHQGSLFASDSTFEVMFTWYDGTHETTPSPVGTIAVPARRGFTVSLPTRAGLQKRLYYRQTTSGNYMRETLSESVSAHTVYNPPPFTVFVPPTTNTFPASTPAVLKSSIGGFQVRGDGSGSWGPLTFNADGTMTSSSIPEWIPVTTFINGASAQTFGRAPAYRVWPDGKVEWRGVVATPASTVSTPFITIPIAARPNGEAWLLGIGNSAQAARVVVRTTGTIDAQPVSGGTLNWFSLDNCSYYLT